MYLKKIEVQGFKSFANKLVFEFDNGITGIVGPNGSGKSNIADAVRWVLGEQSAKQLRGSKMEDIIFAGTQMRKPVSFASVSLTIDNSDHRLDVAYDEVTVARRVYRSGESEYYLNGNACRLKDINELFYDTGVGKECYSIIGQGQIDKILSGKPDERRELFDEAAGIVKFKRRKAAAQKSLDNESQNLVRISDILAELEKQVGPLARQSEKAREYLRLKEELKKFEVNLFLLESDSLTKGLSEVTSKLEIVDNDIESTRKEFEEIKVVYDEKDAKIQAVSGEIDELTAKVNQAEIDKNRLISQIELLKEQINSANSNDSHIAERLKALNDQLEERNEEKQNLLKQKFQITELSDEVFARQNKADKDVEDLNNSINALMTEIDNKKNLIFDNLNEKSVIQSNIQRYNTMLEQINIRKAELNSKLINFKTDESEFDGAIRTLKSQLDSLTSQTDALSQTIKNDDDTIINSKNNRQNSIAELNRSKEQLMRSTSKLETLKNIAERYDGYGNSIRKVMECNTKGVIGVVADIVKTEKKYEIAIETALGGTIQNIVTDTEETAKKMIAYLKQNKFGRATFLPLSAISKRNANKDKMNGEAGFIGYASELVNVDKEYNELAEYLLGRCVVVDTIDNALKLNKKHSYSLKIVTLEGELLNPGGSMTGGAFKNTSNLLGRRREIEDLEAEINKFSADIEKLQNTITSLDKLILDTRAKTEQDKAVLQEKLIEKNTIELQYKQQVDKQNEVKSIYENNHREAKEIEQQIIEIKDSLKTQNAKLEEIQKVNDEANAFIENANKDLDAFRMELIEKNKVAEAIHIEYSGISQKAEFAEEGVKRVLREMSRLRESIEELEESKVDSSNAVTTKNNEIEQITETIEIAVAQIDEFNKDLTEKRALKEELSQSIKSFFDSREACQAKLVELEKEQYRLYQNKERIQNNRDQKIDYMWSEYEITLNQASSLRDEELTNEGEIRKTVVGIKGDIKKLGDVNVNSIEDYKEVSERYEFLKTQHQDLTDAKDKLIGIINELDEGMRERFSSKFEEIKVEFDKVFKQLFGGGKGTIELDPEVDMLEANISIISQPPGKKLQNMMQLSGGEKALTAICLLFAIQNLKPSPFCLLDEIEAALDDSNVDRYAKYLHNLTKNTQFIIITHRRGTMACADRLYGITMQEKGVSTLVSVDLIEKELDEKPKN